MTKLTNLLRQKPSDYTAYQLFLAACIVCVAVIVINFPLMADDYGFLWEINKFVFTKGSDTSFSEFIDGFRFIMIDQIQTDNIRLSNNFALLCLCLPFWVCKVIKFVAIVVFVHYVLKLSGANRTTPIKATFTIFLIVFAIGWQYYLLVFMYICNYIISAIILLIVTNRFLRNEIRPLWGFLMGCLLGISHESYGFAFLGGAILTSVFYRQFINRANLFTVLGCAFGLSCLMSIPGWDGRHTITCFSKIVALRMTYELWIIPIYIAFWFSLLPFKNLRNICFKPLNIFTIATFPLLFVAVLASRSRAALPCNLLVICAFVSSLDMLLSKYNVKKQLASVISIIAAVITLAHLALVAQITIDVHKQSDELDRACATASQKGIQYLYPFLDFKNSWDYPLFALQRPNLDIYNNQSWNLAAMTIYHEMNQIQPVPAILRDFTPEKAQPVPSSPHLWFYNGLLVGPEDFPYGIMQAYINYGKLGFNCKAMSSPFTNIQGQKFKYIYVNRDTFARLLGKPVDAVIYTDQIQPYQDLGPNIYSQND